MPTHYVEDYEEVTGKKREKFAPETKVVAAPKETKPAATEAEVK